MNLLETPNEDAFLDDFAAVFKNPYDVVAEQSYQDEPKEEPTLDFWNDDTWNDTDKHFTLPTSGDPKPTDFASQRAEDIHGVSPAPTADQRAADIHGDYKQMTNLDFAHEMHKRLGDEYEWGGTSKKTGFDCSGIIYRIFQNKGITTVPRTSEEIIAHAKPISLAKAKKTRGAVLWHEGHIAVSAGDGIHTIEAMGEAWGVVKGEIGDRFTKAGILPELKMARAVSGKKPKVNGREQRTRGRSGFEPIDLISNETALGSSSNLTFGVMDVGEDLELARRGATEPEIKGAGTDKGLSDVEVQIRRGFLKAGRPDLARMVGTKAFTTWIGAESGGDPTAVSPANNQGLPNDGYFQVWRGHNFNSNGEFSRYSPQKQARLVATYFSLSPDDIRRYARQIAEGDYEGWG